MIEIQEHDEVTQDNAGRFLLNGSYMFCQVCNSIDFKIKVSGLSKLELDCKKCKSKIAKKV